jgi:hypothetical protein
LVLNPGHLFARYNLACAYVMSGHEAAGLTLLGQFKRESSCPVCDGRLRRAKEDQEWEKLWPDERFLALVKDVPIASASIEEAGKLVRQAINKRRVEPIRHLIHPQHGIKMRMWAGYCDADEKGCENWSKLETPSKLENFLRAEGSYSRFALQGTGKLTCSDKCCATMDVDGAEEDIYFGKVCFDVDSGGAITVKRMDFHWGN